jgi:hypothetical protein
MRHVEHVKHTVIRNAYKISIRKPEGNKPHKYGVDGRTKLKLI